MTRHPRASQIISAMCLCMAAVHFADSFTVTSSKLSYQKLGNANGPPSQIMFSTPFDLDMYDPSEDSELDASSNPFQPEDDEFDASPLAVDPDTKLVLGINKYSHDTTLCAANIETGEVLLALSKERITRKKHDGGNTAELVEMCLDQLDLDLDAVVKVVMNNHHHRILPFIEKNALHMEWEEGLGINGGQEDGYSDEYNILTSVEDKIELSHHLAHAYSAAAQCPFDEGMIVVMDGMGETFRTMKRAVESNDETYFSDFTICAENGYGDIEFVPSDIEERAKTSYFDWREAESVYTFQKDKTQLVIKPIFKRFTEENTPPTLYNHGFENMDSLGAVYSRASSHIFGDWNACGKVMGLAPWQGHIWNTISSTGESQQISSEMPKNHILGGSLYKNELEIDKSSMMGLPFISRTDPDMFNDEGNMIRSKRYDFDDDDFDATESNGSKDGDETDGDKQTKQLPLDVALDAIGLASRVQTDLESVGIDFVRHFKKRTGQTNLCLAGGVALNSVLNGRLSRELGFRNTFIPPYPGDDGIAVGCCAFGLFGRRGSTVSTKGLCVAPAWKEPLSPYLGPLYTDASIKEAISWAAPWLDVQTVQNEKERIDLIVKEIASSGVVALYMGRSELGPRALGHRSVLADPRKKGLVRFINEFVKKRESFRPFAPSALAEEASQWFDLGEYASEANNNVSPYMSITAQVMESKKRLIPAVTHVDGSSRLQTVTSEAEPFYHRLISAFYKATGVPMVLNTSFNTLKSEPIVESPRNAIRSFLSSMGSIEMLIMGDYVIKRKEANVRKLLGEEQKSGLMTPPSFPVRSGTANYRSTFSAKDSSDGGDSMSDMVTLVQIPDRPMHNEMDGGWFELLDDLEGQLLGMCDGTNGVNDMISYFSAISEQEGQEGTQQSDKFTEYDQLLVENILMRLIRLYDHTMISW
ncbi:hypothetical protein HJC23_003666 [Cyclotella cryptica]|uniref:Carbamoyltransferase n=1 Tax=Cyclotella cryptica TaxID=29204 RepID=A0ABD3QR42_9STRA|eukprot:CCRYP_004964-RA/>CCRYP_004964-RA protein AED:0.34 eAED:0.34 QI:249/1/1/1/1/1/3/152/928